MTYIEAAFYSQITGEGAPINFDSLAEVASLMIDTFCGGKIGDNLSSFPESTQERIRQATAYQLSYIESEGGIKAIAAATSGKVNSATIGKFSYSGGESAAAELIQGVGISPLAYLALIFTGLLYRGMDVCE